MANKLQAILKANKVDIAVGIDTKKSAEQIKAGIKSIINDNKDLKIELGVGISSNMKDLNKEIRELQKKVNDSSSVDNAIKLDVKIDSSIQKLSGEIKALQSKIQNTKAIQPIKLDVEIDVKGSAIRIAGELGKIKKTITDFQKDYAGILEKTKQVSTSSLNNLVDKSAVSNIKQSFESINQYMKSAFGDGEYSTKVFRDYKTGIETLSASVKKETGEMYTSLFKLKENGDFELLKDTEVNKMEAQTAKAKNAMEKLSGSVVKLKTDLKSSESFDLFNNLQNKEFVSASELSKLKTLIANEKELSLVQQKSAEYSKLYKNAMQTMSPTISNVTNEFKKMGNSVEGLNSTQISAMISKAKEMSNQYKSDEQTLRKRNELLKVLAETEKKYNIARTGVTSKEGTDSLVDANRIIKIAKSYDVQSASVAELNQKLNELRNAKRDIESVQNTSGSDKIISGLQKEKKSAEDLIKALKDIGKYSQQDYDAKFVELGEAVKTSEGAVKTFGDSLKRELSRAKDEQKELIKNFDLIEAGTKDISKVKIQEGLFNAVKSGDITAVKDYVGQLKNGEVSTISMTEKTNKFGQAVTEIRAKMAGTGKTVEAYTLEVGKSSKASETAVKQTGKAIVDNENKALGFRQQLEIAMKRVPSYILSMQGLYAVVNVFKSMTSELIEINSQMIEIQRVAGAGINMDTVLAGSITMSKELGNNVHDILDAFGEFARTFGDFSESQLESVTKTAIVMSNVSDLTLEESSTTLVGAMNAFNISAEQSIHIVDALNEVDNNYSISTKQLAESISKAGSTASTFGVTLEELAGQTTAIGAVTQESGSIIGNSLKTIYSRLTTMPSAVEAMADVGVYTQKYVDGVLTAKSATEILGDMAGKWSSLTDIQKQNTAVAIAGKNQLSRFLAVMTNWNTAVQATQTGINSAGSAMREQAVHMESYQAKLNALKTRFTELTLAIGQAFLSDGMNLAIKGIANIADALVALINKAGALPIAFAGIGLIAGKFTKLGSEVSSALRMMIQFGGTASGMKGELSGLGLVLTDLFTKPFKDGSVIKTFGNDMKNAVATANQAMDDYSSRLTKTSKTGELLTGSLTLVKGGFTSLKTAVLGFMTSTAGVTLGITALMAGIGIAVEKFIKIKAESDALIKKYDSNIEKSVQEFNKYGNNIDDLVNKYEKLEKAKQNGTLSTEDQEKYNESVKELATILPNAVSYIDSSGQYHLKNTKAIREELQATKDLNQENAKNSIAKFKSDLSEKSKAYADYLKTYKESEENVNADSGDMFNSWLPKLLEKTGTAKNIVKENTAQMSNMQSKMSETLQKSTDSISSNVIALLTSKGAMANVSDAGLGLIDTYTKLNQVKNEDLKNDTDGKKFEKSQEELLKKTQEFGEALASTYDEISTLSGTKGKEATDLFNGMVETLSSSGDVTDDGFAKKVRDIGTAITDMANNAKDFNVDDFQQKLIDMGFGQEEAKKATIDLGTQLENSKIQAQVAQEGLVGVTDELVDYTNATYEAIDAQKMFLGLADGESEDINSRLEYLVGMKAFNPENWKAIPEVQAQLEELSSKTKLSKDVIADNLTGIREAYSTLSGKSVEELASMRGMTTAQLKENYKDVSDAGIALMQQMLGTMNGASIKMEDALVLALSKGAKEIDGQTDTIKQKLANVLKTPDSNNTNAFFGDLKDNLAKLQGQVSVTVDESNGEVQRLFMVDGEKSTYLDTVNGQLDNLKTKLTASKDETDGLYKLFYEDSDGNAHALYTIQQGVESIGISSGLTQKSFSEMKANLNETTQSTWLEGLKAQYVNIGEEVKAVDDGTGKLKLAMANGELDATWANTINSQLDAMGWKLQQTTKDGQTTYSILKGDGTTVTLFSSVATEADKANSKIKETNNNLTETQEKGNKTSTATFNTNDTAVGNTSKKLDDVQKKGNSTNTVTVDSNSGALSATIEDLDVLSQKANLGIGINATLSEGTINALKNADGSVSTTMGRIEGLFDNINGLNGMINQTVTLIEGSVLSKGSSLGEMVTKMGELKDSATKASDAISKLTSMSGDMKFNITGSFNIPEDFDKKMGNLQKSVSTARQQIEPDIQAIQNKLNGLKIGAINTSALDNLRNTVQAKMNEVSAILSTFGATVAGAVAGANSAMQFDASSLIVYKNTSVQTVQTLTSIWKSVQSSIPNIISNTSKSMVSHWRNGLSEMTAKAQSARGVLVASMNSASSGVISAVGRMSSQMQTKFKAGVSGMYSIASTIPSQIGKGISDNMNSATSPIKSLADKLVSNFKSALGIHSPSKVFEQLGGYVIAGLSNGLSGGDLKSLGQSVFKDFGGGVFDSMDTIKAYLSGDLSSVNMGAPSGGVNAWADQVKLALAMNGLSTSPDMVARVLRQIQTESGGNPNAIQGDIGDINNKTGDLAKGLMQTISSTFNANKFAGHGNIFNGFDNLLAALRYAKNRYGSSLSFLGNGHGYYNGGFVDTPELAWHGEEGAEAIIPLIPQRRERGVELWLETAKRLGLGGLFGAKSSLGVGGSMGGFGASDGDSSSSGAGEGGVGTITPSITPMATIEALSPTFSADALDALYKRDLTSLNIEATETKVSRSEAVLKRLTENTLAYRNQLLGIKKLNDSLYTQQYNQYQAMIKRQLQIDTELKKIKNTGKQTEAQRKKWNELQAEYDQNSSTLWKLETTLENLKNEIAQNNVDIYLDYIAEIGNKWTDTIDKISSAQDKLEHQQEKLEYTDPTNIGKQLSLQYDALEQQRKLELTYLNQMKAYQAEYNSAVSKYGASSQQATEMKKMLDDSTKNYEDAEIATLKATKDVADARQKVAEEEISSLKTYYKQMQTLSKSATDKELANLKSVHEEKVAMYDEEIQKINDVYDATIKAREKEQAEEDYDQKIADFNTKRIELMQKISKASRDDSLTGKKNLASLQKELADLNTEITTAQQDRADTLWKEAIEKQKQDQLDAQNTNKETENTNYENQVEEINNKADEINKYYDKLINDDTAWQDAIDKWNNGDTSTLTIMMNDMRDELSKLMSGDGSGIFGTENLSDNDLKEIVGDSLTDVSNIWLSIKDQLTELTSINDNISDLNNKAQVGSNVSGTTYTSTSTSTGLWHRDVEPNLSDPATKKTTTTASKTNSGVKATHTVVKGDTLWDLAKKYYNNYYDWTKIQKANGNINPYTIPIGKKLLIPFDTGGYTGDWTGNGGRVAMLHKKELVLNKNQTKDILDTVSVVDRAKDKLADMLNIIGNGGSKVQTTVGDIYLQFDNFKGTQKEAENVADTLWNALKSKR